MNLDLTDDQIALRDGIRALLEGRFGPERIRGGFDRAMFDELADAGVFSLIADGFSWADAVVVFEQLGEACVPGPLVGSFLAGDRRITGVVEARLGERAVVEHLDALDVLVVLDGATAHRVDPAGLHGTPSAWPLDPLTPVTEVTLPAAAGEHDARADQTRRRGAVLTAALALGMAQRLTEASVAYAKEREQFDRPIGSFQAVKHLLADMAVRVEVARAAVYAAGASLDAEVSTEPYLDAGDVARAVAVAKAMAGDAALRNGKDAVQVHGGMGFTWEVDVHLYLKRAWVLDTHFGSVDAHCDRLGALLGTAPI